MRCLRLTATGALVALALLGAACGSDSKDETTTPATTAAPSQGGTATTAAVATTPSAPNPGGACRLVTGAEAEQAVGAPLAAPTLKSFPAQNGLGLESCTYLRTTGGQGVTASIYTYEGGITSTNFNQFVQSSSNTFEPVAGVGDEAFKTSTEVGADRLLFRKGSKAAEVDLATDTNIDQALIDLAKAAAGRL